MKYSEIHATARPLLTSLDIQNKWIFGECKHVLNVSETDLDDECKSLIAEKGATYEWFPLGENEKLNLYLLIRAMVKLLSYFYEDSIVCCFGGNNRSRLVCEFATFSAKGIWPEYVDEVGLDGCKNRTSFNINKGFLPEISIVENTIKSKDTEIIFHIELIYREYVKVVNEYENLKNSPPSESDPSFFELPYDVKESVKKYHELVLVYLSNEIANMNISMQTWKMELKNDNYDYDIF